MKQKSETEFRNQMCMQPNYSLKFDYTKKYEEGDKKQNQF